MAATGLIDATQQPATTPPVATCGVPIRNIWYMLLYAWGEAGAVDLWRAEVEAAPSLDALLVDSF